MNISWCSFGLHDWGKWSVISEDWAKHPLGQSRIEFVKNFQVRECSVCGKTLKKELRG